METHAGATHASPDDGQERKLRGKYTSQACQNCRQRKLKSVNLDVVLGRRELILPYRCSGGSPCRSCGRRGHDCVYTDDRAVAEILRLTKKQLLSNSMHTVPLAERVRQLEEQMRTVNGRLSIPLADTPPLEEDPDIQSPAKSFQGTIIFQDFKL